MGSCTVRSLNITNRLNQYVLIELKCDASPELAKSAPQSQVVPPGECAGFDIIMTPGAVGVGALHSSSIVAIEIACSAVLFGYSFKCCHAAQEFRKELQYSVNGKYLIRMPCTAEVTSSLSVLECMSPCQVTEVRD